MENLVKEAVAYAKSNKGFDRILEEIMIKYRSLGRFSGQIVLYDIREEESRILGAIDYKLFGRTEAKLSIRAFINYFTQGRFTGLSFEDFIKEYYKEELITNKVLKQREAEIRSNYFKAIIEECSSMKAGVKWLEAAINQKSHGYSSIIKDYENDKTELKEKLINVIKGLSELTYIRVKLEPLPLFSSRITKNPHYFDIGTSANRLFMYGICFQISEKYPQNIEEINEILYSAGIARDELSNFTTIYGIRAWSEDGQHPGWTGFYNEGEPLHISIRNLNSINDININGNNVFIFENPIVFMEVLKELQQKETKLRPALICTSGQLNTASLVLLDKLYNKGYILYYSGDFDPEGLQIADKLKNRYRDRLVLWRYSVHEYIKAKGNDKFNNRENKLSKLKSEELLELKKTMEKYMTCGYQELLINDYVNDIMHKL